MTSFDLIAIGSGPAGQRAAVQASKLGKKAAIVEEGGCLGGVCVNTGTIPSKTMREAILHLTGMRHRGFYGQGYRVKDEVTFADIAHRTKLVVDREGNVIRDQLARNHVTHVEGRGRLAGPGVLVDSRSTRDPTGTTAERFGVSSRISTAFPSCRRAGVTGSAPAHPPDVDFDGKTVRSTPIRFSISTASRRLGRSSSAPV